MSYGLKVLDKQTLCEHIPGEKINLHVHNLIRFVQNHLICGHSFVSSVTLRNNVNTSVNLRSATACCFIPPKPRTEHYKHSLRYSECLVWNSLPDEIKRAECINTFHNRCITWLIK